MVSAVVGGTQSVWLTRVADDCVKIEHGVEVSFAANPLVDSLAVGFAQWAWVIVIRADIRRDRRANDAESVSMGADDDLLVRGEDSMNPLDMCRLCYLALAGEAA